MKRNDQRVVLVLIKMEDDNLKVSQVGMKEYAQRINTGETKIEFPEKTWLVVKEVKP